MVCPLPLLQLWPIYPGLHPYKQLPVVAMHDVFLHDSLHLFSQLGPYQPDCCMHSNKTATMINTKIGWFKKPTTKY